MLHHWSTAGALARLARAGLVAVLIPLAGCATAYQREKVTGGYTDFRLADHTYRVRFKGNNYTSRDKVELFLLYRCAELTAQLGYDHFVLLSEDTLDISDPFAQAGIFPRNYYATALIEVIDDRAHPAAYDAKEVMRKLQAQYPDELGS
jgi:hypothetical protein